MLVDIARNDLARICRPESVVVSEYLEVERFARVMHLVSQVEGVLRDDQDALDALRASFPAGTVSGAPKIRAMEIIADLEGLFRGVYAGGVGYVDFRGIWTPAAPSAPRDQGEHPSLQVGAGFVADSDPDAEYEETLNKARALLCARRRGDLRRTPRRLRTRRRPVMILLIAITIPSRKPGGYLSVLDEEKVVRNDHITVEGSGLLAPDRIASLPGRAAPTIRESAPPRGGTRGEIPILGSVWVIVASGRLGARCAAPRFPHGKNSGHTTTGAPSPGRQGPFEAGRITPFSWNRRDPEELENLRLTDRERSWESGTGPSALGVLFHPIGAHRGGTLLLRNFCALGLRPRRRHPRRDGPAGAPLLRCSKPPPPFSLSERS
jgi:hypothetical protein